MSASAAQQELGYVRPPRATSKRLAFLIFHSANPWVMRTLIKLARARVAKQKAAGRTPKVGMRALWEHMRWEIEDLAVEGQPQPKFNNNLAPEFAHWISENVADLADVFDRRERGDA